MPTTLNAEELTAAVTPAVGFVSKRNAGTLLARIQLLREGGEAEERILARLNGPANTSPLTDDATPSRADGGARALAEERQRRQRLEAARRTTVLELADAVAAKLDERLADRFDRIGAHLAEQLPAVLTSGTVVEQAVAGNVSAVAAANASAATTHDDSVPWQTRPAAAGLPGRETQRETLRHLRGAASVQEVAASLGIGAAGAQSRLVHLHASGHVQRRLVNGRYVYRVHPAIRDLVWPDPSTGATLVREVVAAQRDAQARL